MSAIGLRGDDPLDEWDLVERGFTLAQIEQLLALRAWYHMADPLDRRDETWRLRFAKYLLETGRLSDDLR